MDKDLHDIEDLFKSALEGGEEMPSEKVWHAVDKRLDKENAENIRKKYLIWKRLSFLLLFLLTGFGIYEMMNRNRNFIPTSTVTEKKDLTVKVDAPSNPGKIDNTTKDHNAANEKSRQAYKQTNSISSLVIQQPKVENGNDKNNFTEVNKSSSIVIQDENVLNVESSGDELKRKPGFVFIPLNDARDKEMESIKELLSNYYINLLKGKELIVRESYQAVVKKEKGNRKASSRFSIGAFFSPDISSYHLDDEEDISTQHDNSDQIKKSERHEFSSTTGLVIEYELNRKWSVQSGVTFSNTNIAIQPKTLYAQTENNGEVKYRFNISSGYGYISPTFQPAPLPGDSLKVTAATHKLRYVSIPVAVKYNLTHGKLSIEAIAAVSTNFLTMGKLETEIQRGPNNEVDILNDIEGLRKIYLSGNIGVSAKYPIIKKIFLVLAPTARFALMPINKNSIVKTYPYSLGLTGGLQIKF